MNQNLRDLGQATYTRLFCVAEKHAQIACGKLEDSDLAAQLQWLIEDAIYAALIEAHQ